MPRLSRLRFVSVGHPQARLDDVTLDFRAPEGRATDSTIWLRNGGGKSSLLNLFFAIVRPSRREFLGGKADAKQRTLDDYILPGDRSVTAAEWELDPAADSLGLEVERLLTGVFYERRDGAGEPRHLFFSCRISAEHPETTLEGLPVYATTESPRTRRTLVAFREAWRALRDRAPHLQVSDTEQQREWQEILESARIDPELFSYQVRMNQREGGADELFRFAEAEEFIDFLLALALEPALGDRVGRNLTAFRRELLQRKEQLVPERNLVEGLLDRMCAIRAVRTEREKLRYRLGETRELLEALDGLATRRVDELREAVKREQAECERYSARASELRRSSAAQHARASLLRRHAAALRLERLQQEYEQVQEEWRSAQRLAKVWAAAVPLRRAIQFEEKAREQRALLESRQRAHAPLRASLAESARRLASALRFRSEDLRAKAGEARNTEDKERGEARTFREQGAGAHKLQGQAETRASALERRLSDAAAKQLSLVGDRLLADGEAPDAGLARWTSISRDHAEATKRVEADIGQIDCALAALDEAIRHATDTVGEWQAKRSTASQQLESANRERLEIEADVALRAALELEHVDADRLDVEAVHTVDQAARGEQRVVVEGRLAMADDERAALHVEERGLLPPTTDAQRVLDFLSPRLGGQAWSGWSWIEANVPKEGARDAIRKAPGIALGVVVRPEDRDRASQLVREAGIEPDGPVLLTDTSALDRAGEPPGHVLGPRQAAWFDRDAAHALLAELQNRLGQQRERIDAAEARHREFVRVRETLRAFRARHPVGWFERHVRELQELEENEREARSHVKTLERDRKVKTAARKELEARERAEVIEHRQAESARERLSIFVEDHVRPAAEWRAQLELATQEATSAAQDAAQWDAFAIAAEARAGAASADAQAHGENARVVEVELLAVRYVEGQVEAEAGPVDELRDRYRLLSAQYEDRVGADALAALASANDDNAREERQRLSKLLSADVTEDVVHRHLRGLAEPDIVDQLRGEAEAKVASLFGRVGNLKGQIVPATNALETADKACKDLVLVPPLRKAPSTPDLAEAEALGLEAESKRSLQDAEAAERSATEAKARAATASQNASDLATRVERLRTLRDDYEDLLAAALPTAGPQAVATLDESGLHERVSTLGDQLRSARSAWKRLDGDRGAAIAALRSFAGSSDFEKLDVGWLRRLQEHDEPGFEDASAQLSDHLELRRKVLDDQISGVDRHRSVIIDELQAVADEGLKLLRQASSLSKLPDHVPGLGGAHFLRIETREPDDPAERRARLAELVDELVGGERDIGGVALVQAAVRRLARPAQVRVLHPDPALDRRTVSIPEMARASGGEQLTGAILLYCTLARVRGRARGLSKKASSVLLLDNPIGRASRVRFLELQRDVARAMGVQLIYTTGVNDHEALRALPNIMRLRNERVDRNTGRRLVEHAPTEERIIEAVQVGRRESLSATEREG